MSYQVFQELCEKHGVRPGTVSRATGIATSTLTSWKKGRYTPKADKLQKIAAYFNVPVDLFYASEPKGKISGHKDEYYQDEETAQLGQEMLEDSDMRALYHMKKNMDADKFKAHITMMKELYRLEHPEEYPEDYMGD